MDPLTMGIMGGTGLVGAGMSLFGANQQADAMKAQIAAQNKLRQQLRGDLKDVYGTAQSDVNAMYQPFTQLAGQGVAGMQQDYGVPIEEFDYNRNVNEFLDPSIAYQQELATDAVQSGAAASGQLLSGAAQKAIADRSQKIGEMGYADAYQRMVQDREAQYGKEQDIYSKRVQDAARRYSQAGDITQLGMGAIGQQADATQNFATQYGSNLSGTAPQSAAGVGGQVWGQTLGNLGSGIMGLAGNMGQGYFKNR
jgi:hypothetical protein